MATAADRDDDLPGWPSNSQLTLLHILWRHGEPLAVRDLIGHLPDYPPYTTVQTQLMRLIGKGLVSRQPDPEGLRGEVYSPLISWEVIARKITAQVCRQVFDGRPTDLALIALEGAELSPANAARLAARAAGGQTAGAGSTEVKEAVQACREAAADLRRRSRADRELCMQAATCIEWLLGEAGYGK